jgi:hypothetical protein
MNFPWQTAPRALLHQLLFWFSFVPFVSFVIKRLSS